MSHGSRSSTPRLAIACACLALLLFAPAASAGLAPTQGLGLTITRINAGGTTATNQTGSGNLPSIFNAAADWWELAIGDAHTVAITYSWANLGFGILGQHLLTGQGPGGGGLPSRETSATIQFNNSLALSFFLDGTPKSNSEYQTYTASSANLGGGVINTGRVWTNPVAGPASSAWDLFSVVLHEVGHALGISSSNTQYQSETWTDNDIDVLSPRPFNGTTIPVNNSVPVPPGTSNAHMRVSTPSVANTLMVTSLPSNTRRWGSALDILANAELQDFNTLNLNPGFPIPEPATIALLGIGLIGLAVGVRRRRRKA